MIDISQKEELIKYLSEKNIISNAKGLEIHFFSGGVSGATALIKDGNVEFLVKQAYEKLKVKESWECDQKRIKIEYDALAVYKQIVPEAVPTPLSFDEENYIMIREAVSEDWKMWKSDLLDGILKIEVAEKAIDALSKIHNSTSSMTELRDKFGDGKIFYDLRADAYILHLTKKYPQLKQIAEKVVAMLMESGICLIHGDYSPKNILVKGSDICILDLEVAYYGNPCFDLAFFANHLLLKAVLNKKISSDYLEMMKYMMDRYFSKLSFMEPKLLEKQTVHTLGLLFLARVDGKSPVEYLTSEQDKNLVRNTAMRIIEEEMDTVEQVIACLKNAIERHGVAE